jgi:hypothetical protein
MRSEQSNLIGPTLLFLSLCALGSCSHYANVAGNFPCQGAGQAACNPPPPAPTPPLTVTSPVAGLQANTAFTASPASRPVAGANATAPVIASAPRSGFPPAGTAFPLTQSAVLIAANTVVPDSATNSGGATLVYDEDGTAGDFTLHLLSQGVKLTAQSDYGLSISPAHMVFSSSNIMVDGVDRSLSSTLNYALPGVWIVSGASSTSVGAFMAGMQTAANAVPTLGTASFLGYGRGSMFNPAALGSASNPTGVGLIEAYVTVNANFGSGAITGNLVTWGVFDTSSVGASATTESNGIGFSAQIAAGTNSFTGTTSATSAPPTANGFALKANAAGTIDGQFYGPNAQEVGAVWTLSDGTGSEIGSFGVKEIAIGAPAPGSYGSTPVPALIATTCGPTFDGSGAALPASVSFPVLASSLQITPDSVAAADNNQSATVTLDSVSNTLHVVIPSVNIDQSISISGPLTSGKGQAGVTGLSYVALGSWGNTSIGETPASNQSMAMGVFGYETPASAMPTAGTATYTGAGTVRGMVYVPTADGPLGAQLKGDANLSADFASGNITGKLNNITAYDGCFTETWNDVSVSANIAPGTSKFSGTTATPSQPGNTFYSLKSTATGAIKGGFYGPAAQQLGAIWGLSDGTSSAIGGVVAGH